MTDETIPAGTLRRKADRYRQITGLDDAAVIAKAKREHPELPLVEALAELLANVNLGTEWERS